MTGHSNVRRQGDGAGFDAIIAMVAAEGGAAHRYRASLVGERGGEASRNLADAVHFLCLLHGRHPGVLDHATWRATDDAVRERLELLAGWFDRERALLTRLVVAVGPMPSTPGQSQSESAVLAQHHALSMLSKSDRPGCALGAVIALVADWNAIRPLLDVAAERLSVPHGAALAVESEAAPLAAACASGGAERAMMFGAQQLLSQHRGLWDLLEARASARADLL